MKMALTMTSMFGEDESQRQREIRIRRERDERAKSRAKFFHSVAVGARKLFFMAFGMGVALYLIANTGRFEALTSQLSQRISARLSTHNTLEQNALQYQNEVNQITK